MTTTNMTPIDWAKRPIEKYADFSGRAPRAEYWWFYLATIVAYIVATIIDSILGLDGTVGPYGVVVLVLMLALLIPGLAATVRRLHDTNRSGWWILIAIVPYFILGILFGMAFASGSMAAMGGVGLIGGLIAVAGGIALLVFMILPGTPGDNRYGPDPYGRGAPATV